jgi:hypothetical protein
MLADDDFPPLHRWNDFVKVYMEDAMAEVRSNIDICDEMKIS